MSLKSFFNYAFFRCYRYRRVVRRHLSRYYSQDEPKTTTDERIVVCMADGRYLHGGLADRLRSFATFYGYCREHGLRFAINFTFPFRLEDYLLPADYDWRLKSGELTFNSRQAHAVYMDNTSDCGEREMRFQRRVTEKFLGDKRYIQHHVYSSFYYDEANFGRNFRALFRPSERVEAAMNIHLAALGSNFISVSTRFLELLGDFHEPKGGTRLSRDEGERLIARCIEQLAILHERHPSSRILVTSDSRRFLSAAAEALPSVYVVEGDIAHVDVAGSTDHLKTFLDFLLIGHATKAYQLQTSPMYGGNFSLRAAQAGDRAFERIIF